MSALEEVGRAIATVVASSREATEAALIALVSVATQLLMLLRIGLAHDMDRWKEAKLRRLEAQADKEDAEAGKARSEANKTDAEAQKLRAESLKTLAEAATIANKAQATEAAPTLAPEEALAQLKQALGVLQAFGGGLHVDAEELSRLTSTSDR